MKVFVTGADGMLGSSLVRVLLDRGADVSVLIHPASKGITLEGLPVERYSGDVLDPVSLGRFISGYDAVIHAAASTSTWPSRSALVRRINIEGTANVIEASLAAGVRRFIYVGSGSSVNAAPVPGSRYPFPAARYRLDYIDSKYCALQLVMEAASKRGLPALAVLPTFMIGPYDTLPGSGKMILAVASGRLKFYTSGGRNFVSSSDVAVATANALEKGLTGKWYIAGNENLTYREFFTKVASVVGRPRPRIMMPGWLVKGFGLAGELTGRLLHRAPLLSYPMARISCDRNWVQSDDAVRELAMPQTDIEVAIAECYQWFVTHGYVNKSKP